MPNTDRFDLVRQPDSSRIIPAQFRPEGADSRRDAQDFAGLLASWTLVRAHKLTVLAVIVACLLAAVAFTMLQTPTYRAHTAIEVDLRNEYFLNLREIDSTFSGVTAERYLQTQIQILQSESMVKEALARLNGEVPAPSNFLRTLIGPFRPKVERSTGVNEETLATIAQNLSLQPLRQGNVIDVNFDSTNGPFAADFLNALTESFIEQSADVRERSSRLTQVRLNKQLREVKAQLESSERALQDYARHAGLIFTSEKTSTAENQLRVLEQELAAARSDRIQREAQRGIAASNSSASLPSVLDNPMLRDYQVKLMELRRRRAELLSLFTANHPEVKQVEAQLQEVESSLEGQRKDVVDRIRNEYEAARQREALLLAAVDEQTRRVTGDSVSSVGYHILQREVETNRALYDTMLQRARNAGLASAMEIGNIRVIDPATAPSRPFKPRLGENAAIAGIGGIVLGIIVALVSEGKDRRIRSPLDLRSYINVQQLGIVPYIACEQKRSEIRSLIWSGSGVGALTGPYGSYDELADSFRATLTSILSANRNESVPQTIVVTSPTPGDGKSTVVCNLGIALAEVKGRVLLIDADTRNPSLHRMFNIRNTVGLTDILRGDVEFSDSLLTGLNPVMPLALRSTASSGNNGSPGRNGLYLLSLGIACENATALLYSNRMNLLLQTVRRDFDMVLIDTPPMLQVPNARVLGRQADGVVLVVRSGRTSTILAREAITRLEDDFILTFGAVLNAFDSRRSPYRYYGRYPDSEKSEG